MLATQVLSYNLHTANISVILSASAYCGKDNYTSMKLIDPVGNFKVADIIYDRETDMQGFTGTLNNNIYVVFRGSSSIRNWIEDLSVLKTPYLSYPECNCMIHEGFYTTSQNIKNQVIKSVEQLMKQRRRNIILTGHSYGAVLANIMSLELLKYYKNIEMYNFGQPKGGNEAYANFFNKKMTGKAWRITHYNDIVPHLTEVMYYHSCQEIYEDENNKLHLCNKTNCEDPECSDKFKLYQTSAEAHMTYLNQDMHCDAVTVK
jgi:hypothetical protein